MFEKGRGRDGGKIHVKTATGRLDMLKLGEKNLDQKIEKNWREKFDKKVLKKLNLLKIL